MQNSFFLLLGESLEVIRLDSVGSKLGNFSGLVLGHEVVIISVVKLVGLRVLPDFMLKDLAVLFLLSQNLVDRTSVSFVFTSLGSMILLSFT